MKRSQELDDSEDTSPKKRKELEDNVEIPELVAPQKTPINFSISEFRSELKKSDGLKYLRDFANCAEWGTSTNDVVTEFLQAGGTVAEITSLLDVTAQGDLATALPVFRAVFLVLLKIQAEATDYKAAALRDAENLLSTFVPAFQGMISINSPKNRKVVLKLLATLVTLQPSFGRQIINWFSLTPTQLESYVEPGPVRKAFVLFLLSFFFEGNVSTFRPLLDKKGLLSSILPNLKYEDVGTAVLVLNVLTDKMLMNPKLTKTIKLNVFNTQAIQCLFQLYDWVGPKGASKGWKKRPKKHETDPEAAAAVKTALTRLLKVLCTDKRFGVVFADKALGASGQLNPLILTALDIVPKPWKKPDLSELVADILVNSPDLIKVCLTKWGASFEPRLSEAWNQSVAFLIKVLEGIDPERTMSGALEALTPAQIQTALMGILMNPSITKHLQASQGDSQPISIRCQGLDLFRIIISVLHKMLNALRKASCFGTVKKHLVHNLSLILPDVSGLCQLWHGKSEEFPVKKETIARFLLEMARLEPSLIKDKSELSKMFIKNVLASHEDAKLTADVLQIVCLLDPSFISPNYKRFRAILVIAFKLSCVGDYCINTLAHMLAKTSLFADSPGHLDVWLFSWKRFADESSTHIAEILVNAISKTINSGSNLTHFLVELMEESRAAKDVWSDSQCERNQQFLTFLLLHLGCLPEFNVPTDAADLVILDVEKCLDSNCDMAIPTKKRFHPVKPQLAFLQWICDSEDTDLAEVEELECFSVLLLTLHLMRTWVQNGRLNKDSVNWRKSKLAFEFVKKETSPDSIPAVWRPNDYFISSDSSALFAKMVESIFTDEVLMKSFSIYDNEFSCWAKEMVVALDLTSDRARRWMPAALMAPWKKRLLKQLQKHIRNNLENDLSIEFHFWMCFLQPSGEELMAIIESLCTIEPGTAASSPSIGFIWSSVIDALGSGTASKELLKQIVEALCTIVSLTCDQHFHEAIFKLFSQFALSVMSVPKGFLRDVIGHVGAKDDALIRALVVYTESWPTKELVNLICEFAATINGRLSIALIGSILKRKGSLERSAMTSLAKSVELVKQDLDKRLQGALREIARQSEPFLMKFIGGKKDAIISDFLLVLHLLVFEMGEINTSTLAKLAEKKEIALPALASVLTVLSMKCPAMVGPLLEKLISDPKKQTSWKDNADAVETVLRDDELVKDFVAVRTSHAWKKFVKVTLRDLSPNDDSHRWRMLRTITEKTWSEGADNSELANLFTKCTSHPDFTPLMLSSSPVKDEVVGLLLAIVRLWPNVMVLNHIPLYLAAYSAQLTACDQRLLQILYCYEDHLGSLSKFEPFFWGQPAVSHYSVRSGGGLSLWKQISMKSVLDLLEADKMLNTVANYPIDRKLKNNTIASDEAIYDPSFLLPLFSKLLSPGAVPYCLSFVHRGGLSLCIAALSSRDVDMRNAAAVVLSRFYAHLQLLQHTKQKPVWLHIIDCIRYGLDGLSGNPVPGVVTVFWARAVMEVSDPQAPLYSLHRLLLAKPSANLRIIPEFITLFFSQDVNYALQRRWILGVVRDSVRHEDDVMLLLKSSFANNVLTYFNASYATNDIKIIILQVFERIVRVGMKCERLLEELGLDLWLRTACREIRGNLLGPFKHLLKAAICYQSEWQTVHGRVVKKPAPTFLDAALLRLQSSFSKSKIAAIVPSA